MNDSVIDTEPNLLVEAAEENLLGHVAFLQERLPGMTVERRDGLVIVDSGLASDTFNKVLAARLAGDEADARIDQALADVRRTGRPFTWWVGPCSRPVDLEERLRRHGLREQERELGMTINLDQMPDRAPLPDRTTIRSVTTPARLADFAAVLAGLGDPPDPNIPRFFEQASDIVLAPESSMRFFVAYVDGQPAAVSELFIGGGIAGVHMVATATAFRRRGLGMALTWRALDEGRRRDLAVGALQASAEGQPVYERLGFEPCGQFTEYALKTPNIEK